MSIGQVTITYKAKKTVGATLVDVLINNSNTVTGGTARHDRHTAPDSGRAPAPPRASPRRPFRPSSTPP